MTVLFNSYTTVYKIIIRRENKTLSEAIFKRGKFTKKTTDLLHSKLKCTGEGTLTELDFVN